MRKFDNIFTTGVMNERTREPIDRFKNQTPWLKLFAVFLLVCGNNQNAALAASTTAPTYAGEDFLDIDKVKSMPEIPRQVYDDVERFRPANFAEVAGKIASIVLHVEIVALEKHIHKDIIIENSPLHPGYYRSSEVYSDDKVTSKSRSVVFMNFESVANWEEFKGTFGQDRAIMLTSTYVTRFQVPGDFDKLLSPGSAWDVVFSNLVNKQFSSNGKTAKDSHTYPSTWSCKSGTASTASSLHRSLTGKSVAVHCEVVPQKPEEFPSGERDYVEYVYLKDYGVFLVTKVQNLIRIPGSSSKKKKAEPDRKVSTYSVASVELNSAHQ